MKEDMDQLSFAIMRTRCIGGNTASADTPWQKILTTHKIRCNFTLDSDVSNQHVNSRTEALLGNLMIHSGFDLNLCEQPDNVLVYPSRPSVLHLSFSACYMVVSLASPSTSVDDTVLYLPVTPTPWDFSWNPERTSVLSVDMNLTEAKEIFTTALMRNSMKQNTMRNPKESFSNSTLAKERPSKSCMNERNHDVLEAILKNEMKGVNALLGILLVAGVALAVFVAWIGNQLIKKKGRSKQVTKSPTTNPSGVAMSPLAAATVCVQGALNEDDRVSPITLDSGVLQPTDLEKEWSKNHEIRRRSKSHHKGKMFLVPYSGIEDHNAWKAATTMTPDRVTKPMATEKNDRPPNLVDESSKTASAVASFLNEHWGV